MIYNNKFIYFKFSLFIILISFCYLLNKSFPFYFLWDMEHTVTLDIISIFSNTIPTHINHPGLGTYLILSWWDFLLFKLNIISGISISDIKSSISPIFLIYEITNSNRAFHIFLIPIITFLLSNAILNFGTNKSKIAYLFTFGSIGSGFGLLYHSVTIRSEIYSILFFCISFLLISNHSNIRSQKLKIINIVFVGIFSGLVIYSKLQGIFYYLFLITLSVFYCRLNSELSNDKKNSIIHSLFNLFSFIIIGYISYKFPIQGGYAVFAEDKDFTYNTFYYLFLIIFSIPLLIIILSLYYNQISISKIMEISNILNYLLTGFLISTFSPFTLYLKNSVSLKYSLWNFKILFIRKTYNDINITNSIKSFLSLNNLFLEEYKIYFFVIIILFLGTLYFNRKNISNILIIFSIFIITLLNSSIAPRYMYRDFIWIELLLIISIYMFLNLIKKKYTKYFYIIISLTIINSNISQDLQLKSALESQVNLYGYNKKRHLETVYGDVLNFNQIIKLKYPNEDSMNNIIKEFDKIQEHIDVAYSIVKIFPLSVKNIGVVNKQLMLNNNEIHFYNFPKFLEGFTLIQIPHEINKSFRFNSDLVRKNKDIAGKIYLDSSGVLPLMYRWNLDIFILSKYPLNFKNKNGSILLMNEKVQIEDKNFKLYDYNLYKVNEYTEISKEELMNNSIYILGKNNYFIGSDNF